MVTVIDVGSPLQSAFAEHATVTLATLLASTWSPTSTPPSQWRRSNEPETRT